MISGGITLSKPEAPSKQVNLMSLLVGANTKLLDSG
jgi:hypothetical protein